MSLAVVGWVLGCSTSDRLQEPFALGGTGGLHGGGGPGGGDSPSPMGGTGGSVPGSGGTGGMLPTGGLGGGPVPACQAPEVWCNTGSFLGCVELGTPEHCAFCGNACGAGESCIDGSDDTKQCSCVSGTRCPAGTGDCVDLLVDEAHCGGCDVRCGARAECVGGECGCTDTQFPDAHENPETGLADCYDFATDVEHCGDFDTRCLSGETCAAGTCICEAPNVYCPEDGAPAVCVDLQRDVSHCSACGFRCPENGLCRDGVCRCQPDAPTVCHAGGGGHGGAGGNGSGGFAGGGAVDGGIAGGGVSAGGVPGGGVAGAGASAGGTVPGGGQGGLSRSGRGGASPGGSSGVSAAGAMTHGPLGSGDGDPGMCVDTETHPHACGSECADCFVTVGLDAVCSAGVCECPPDTEICIDTETTDNICVNKQTDERHCGTCGNACQADIEECWAGECVDSPCAGICDGATTMNPGQTGKTVGCYELAASQIPATSLPRIVGWSFSPDFSIEVNGEVWDTFTDGSDHPLGAQRLGGWCIEVTAGSATIYAPND